MKKFFSLFLFIFISTMLCPGKNIMAAEPLKLNTTKKTMYVNDKYNLKVNNTTKKIMWKSSNTEVAEVNKSGKVTALAKGKATITATIGAGSNNTKLTCTITVKGRLSTNIKDASLYTPMDEYQEILITFAKPRDGEFLTAKVDNYNVEIEFGDGDAENNIISLYVTPVEKGISTITLSIGKYDTPPSSKNSDTEDSDTSYELAEREYITRFASPYITYDPIKVTVYVGFDNSAWINDDDLWSVYGITPIIESNAIYLIPNVESGTTKKSFSIPIEEKELNKEYSHKGLRYKFIKSNTVEFYTQDLRDLKIIK